MPISPETLFDTSRNDLGAPGSREWNKKIFERAYCSINGPFDRVRKRLKLGFSVLVYVPGNCMMAAADYINEQLGSAVCWTEYGQTKSDSGVYEEMWTETRGAFKGLLEWYEGKEKTRQKYIFHNLNLLGDGQRGVLTYGYAQQALFSLLECSRKGIVLGLSDRDAGELPEAISMAFDEHTWLHEIPLEGFQQLIPRALQENLYPNGDIPDGVDWLIASRLRSSDPIRAVNIMTNAIESQHDLPGILRKIMEATPSVQFVNPDELFPREIEEIEGFEPKTIELLQRNIIQPYVDWKNTMLDNQGDYESKLSKLPTGLILQGPPGTGKSYLARWIAKSIGLPLRTVKGADIRAGEWGRAEKNVHRLFSEVRRAAPCVLVLDDADDLFPDRASIGGSVAGGERAVVNAALQELEGFAGSLSGVLVILTTNRYTSLDSAIASRLPIHLRVPYPLTEPQLRDIITQVAKDYHLTLTDKVGDKLVKHFSGEVRPRVTAPVMNVADRDEGRFSPREIRNAMRLLCTYGKDNSDTPTLEDVKRMIAYYDQLPVPQVLQKS